MNFFEFYEIPVSFRVDEAALKRTFYKNSKTYHPDFHTLSDLAQQAEMLEKSSLNNQAFKTLSDFDRRMQYVLEMTGTLETEGENKLPGDFLAEMMELNEAVMELEFDLDPELLSKTQNTVKVLENQYFEKVRPFVETWSGEPGNEAGLQAVKEYFLKKRYLLRILENLSKFAPGFSE